MVVVEDVVFGLERSEIEVCWEWFERILVLGYSEITFEVREPAPSLLPLTDQRCIHILNKHGRTFVLVIGRNSKV